MPLFGKKKENWDEQVDRLMPDLVVDFHKGYLQIKVEQDGNPPNRLEDYNAIYRDISGTLKSRGKDDKRLDIITILETYGIPQKETIKQDINALINRANEVMRVAAQREMTRRYYDLFTIQELEYSLDSNELVGMLAEMGWVINTHRHNLNESLSTPDPYVEKALKDLEGLLTAEQRNNGRFLVTADGVLRRRNQAELSGPRAEIASEESDEYRRLLAIVDAQKEMHQVFLNLKGSDYMIGQNQLQGIVDIKIDVMKSLGDEALEILHKHGIASAGDEYPTVVDGVARDELLRRHPEALPIEELVSIGPEAAMSLILELDAAIQAYDVQIRILQGVGDSLEKQQEAIHESEHFIIQDWTVRRKE